MAARLRGTAAGLVLTVGEASDISEARAALQAIIEEKRTFLAGARLVLDCGGLAMAVSELSSLLEECANAGLEVSGIETSSELTRNSARSLGLRLDAALQPGTRSRAGGGEITSPEMVEGECALVVGTVRSGQAIWHPGSVIVFGDVNAGAEIVAGGSVVVWGVLRGTVHAGAGGDDTAVVCALALEPTQLRLGGKIARPPDEPRAQRRPELARLQDGAIVVETWADRQGRHSPAPQNRLAGALRAFLGRFSRGAKPWGA